MPFTAAHAVDAATIAWQAVRRESRRRPATDLYAGTGTPWTPPGPALGRLPPCPSVRAVGDGPAACVPPCYCVLLRPAMAGGDQGVPALVGGWPARRRSSSAGRMSGSQTGHEGGGVAAVGEDSDGASVLAQLSDRSGCLVLVVANGVVEGEGVLQVTRSGDPRQELEAVRVLLVLSGAGATRPRSASAWRGRELRADTPGARQLGAPGRRRAWRGWENHGSEWGAAEAL